MSARAAWIACAIAGVFVILVAQGFGMIPNLESCGPDHGLGPVMGFELATAPTEFEELFGEEPCRGNLIEAMRTMLWVDALAFIPVYTALLVFALIALRDNGPKIAAAGIAAALAGAVFDQIEGFHSFAIISSLSDGEQARLVTIVWLAIMVRGKFALLALATMAIGWLHSRQGGWWRLSGLIITAGAAVMMAGLAHVEVGGLLTLGGLIGWTWLFGVALWRAWRGGASDKEKTV